MLSSLALTLLLAAPVKIAATGFTVTGDEQSRASVWLERFAEVMRRDQRVEVTTAADLTQLIGMERQKQLLGCNELATTCLTELANALGAEGILVGTITRSGDSYLAVVKVLHQKNGAVWWSASGRVTGENALLDWLDEQARNSVNVLVPPAPIRAAPLVLGGAGIVAAGVGATLVALSNTVALEAVRNANAAQLTSAIDSGRAQNVAGVVLLGVGGAALITSAIWLLLPGDPPAKVALMPTPGGAFAAVGGEW